VQPCAPPRRAWSNTPDRSTSRLDTDSSHHLSAARANAHLIDRCCSECFPSGGGRCRFTSVSGCSP
jgi:hypothetical protein